MVKRILVAGGSGMIGRALCGRLGALPDGPEVVAVGRQADVAFASPRVAYLRADLLSHPSWPRGMEDCDAAVLCAGPAGGRGAFASGAQAMALEAGRLGLAFLQACVERGARRALIVASATSYPARSGAMSEEDLAMEEDPAEGQWGLGWTWRYLEKMARWLGEKSGLEVVVLRTANIFGPYSRFDPAASNFIPALIRKAVDKMDPFPVYGSPKVSRDALYVDHLIDAMVELLYKKEVGVRSFNIGSGYPTTVGQVAEWALAHAGHRPSRGVVYEEDNHDVPLARYLDCARLRRFIDWSPPPSAEAGVAALTRWWQENRETWAR